MKVKISRDRTRNEGDYGAWDGHVWDGDTYIGAVTGPTREQCLNAARALVARYQDNEAVTEWVTL